MSDPKSHSKFETKVFGKTVEFIEETLQSPMIAAFFLVFGLGIYVLFRFSFLETAVVPDHFKMLYSAVEQTAQGLSPYKGEGVINGFRYSPSFLAILSLFQGTLRDAWFYFSTLTTLGFLLSLLGGARYRSGYDLLYLVGGLLFAWRGILECLANGEIELIVFSVLILASSLFSRYTVLSGAVLAFLPWLKLPLIFFILPFILACSRQYQTEPTEPLPPSKRLKMWSSGFILSTVFFGAVVPSAKFGSDRALSLMRDWMELLRSHPSPFFDSTINQSVWGSVHRLLGLTEFQTMGLASILIGALVGLLILRRPHQPTAQDSFAWSTPWLIMSQLINPFGYRWGSIYLIGTFFSASLVNRRWIWLRLPFWLMVIALFLLQQNFVTQYLGLENWTHLHHYGTVTLYWVLILLLTL